MQNARRERVLILDFGSQYTQLIARRVRECGVYCEIHPFSIPVAEIRRAEPHALILSGGPSSVYAEGAPRVSPELFSLGVPILGVCYGLQLIAHLLGGRVERAISGEYGPATVRVDDPSGIFGRFSAGDTLDVWMSHGDRLEAVPPGFHAIGSTPGSPLCALANPSARIYGIQFHPEVTHTSRGREILKAFLHDVAGLLPTWTPASFIEQAIDEVRAKVGPDASAVLGLSGGVDSSVAAVLCQRALGDRLVCIFVDNGLLRSNEASSVIAMFKEHLHLHLVHVDASARFLDALRGVTDPEVKRKTIGRVFIEVFEEEAKKIDDAASSCRARSIPT